MQERDGEEGDPREESLGLDVYARPGPLTDAGEHRSLFANMPKTVPELCRIVQGLILHVHWSPAYGLTLPPERRGDSQARTLPAILDRILELDPRPLPEARELEARFMGTCRDFTLLLVALLRDQGVPARARCGFGSYFSAGRFEDHWVCEHWDAEQHRWVRSDAQIDDFQRKALKLDLDVLDLSDDHFVVGGEAWRRCRSEEADPALFGIFDMHGMDFVRGNVWRDLAALNRVEVLPWDDWGLLLRLGNREGSAQEIEQVDRIAAACNGRRLVFDGLKKLYDEEPEVRVPGSVHNWQTGTAEEIPGLTDPGEEARRAIDR